MLLSLDAYNDFGATTQTLAAGWQRIDPTAPTPDPDPEVETGLGLSTGWDDFGFNAAAYKRGNEIVIAYRGWDQNDPNDRDDIFLGAYAGLPFRQMALAQQFFDAVKAANPTATMTLTGHSLGGGLASAIAVREDITAEVFAAHSRDPLRSLWLVIVTLLTMRWRLGSA